MVKIEVDERTLYQLLISELRYSIGRDNHLAPSTCVNIVMQYLPEMSKEWRTHTAHQLTDEIIRERLWGNHEGALKQDEEWEKLLLFLTDYLDTLPVNADRYMTYLYNKPEYNAHIDYYSIMMAEKIQHNQNNMK